MNQIEETFIKLKERQERALVTFVTAGDPNLEQLPDILDALAKGGADIIEVGLPFSDPIADGPVIQASSQRSLDRGTTTIKVLDQLNGFSGPPIVLMGYMNPILRMGFDGFATSASYTGVSGTIICDLSADESDEWINVSRKHGLSNIFLAAPTSTDERLDEVVKRSSGFVYAVSRTGVTGADLSSASEGKELVDRLRLKTQLPVCVGFGVSKPEDVNAVCQYADGAVVGSFLVQFLSDNWNDGKGKDALINAVRSLKAATQS